MPVQKIVGIETEYGISLRNSPGSLQVTQDFFRTVCPRPIPCDHSNEFPTRDARRILPMGEASLRHPSRASSGDSLAFNDILQTDQLPGDVSRRRTPTIPITIQTDLSTFLVNGARFYIDHAHPEYCTPECLTARELVAYDKAGERLLMQMVKTYNQARSDREHVVLYKNNVDYQGNSYGCHENYLIDASTYQEMFNNRSHWVFAYLVPYLVTRQVFCGAGKVGSCGGKDSIDYQISQRSDFFECVLGLQTMQARPIVNTRDESHAEAGRHSRLHVICGDANLAEWSTYLKVAVTQLILEMLEAGFSRFLNHNITLADPVNAIRTISRDPTLQAMVELEHGRKWFTALHLQRLFIEAAQVYLDSDVTAYDRWNHVWQDWAMIIENLEKQPESLDHMLDWRIKQKFLQRQLERKGLGWQNPLAKELDFRYHQLDSERGIFYLLGATGQVENWLNGDEVDLAVSQPPETTRAYLRGYCIKHFQKQIVSGNWDILNFANSVDPSAMRTNGLSLFMPDPTIGTRGMLESVLNGEVSLQQLLDYMPENCHSYEQSKGKS